MIRGGEYTITASGACEKKKRTHDLKGLRQVIENPHDDRTTVETKAAHPANGNTVEPLPFRDIFSRFSSYVEGGLTSNDVNSQPRMCETFGKVLR